MMLIQKLDDRMTLGATYTTDRYDGLTLTVRDAGDRVCMFDVVHNGATFTEPTPNKALKSAMVAHGFGGASASVNVYRVFDLGVDVGAGTPRRATGTKVPAITVEAVAAFMVLVTGRDVADIIGDALAFMADPDNGWAIAAADAAIAEDHAARSNAAAAIAARDAAIAGLQTAIATCRAVGADVSMLEIQLAAMVADVE